MYLDYTLYRMEYKTKILSYRLNIGSQNFDIDADVFIKTFGLLSTDTIKIKDLKIVKDVIVLEDILKEGSSVSIDVTEDVIFIEFLKNTIDLTKYQKEILVKPLVSTVIADKVGNQLNMLVDSNFADFQDVLDTRSVGHKDSVAREEALKKELDMYGVRLDKTYKVGSMANILLEPYIVGLGASTKLKYKPLYDKHRRFFSNVVFLVDHVKTTTGGVKAKRIIFTLLNDNRFKKATELFLSDLNGDMDYNRIRVWYKVATSRDMLECKGKVVTTNGRVLHLNQIDV